MKFSILATIATIAAGLLTSQVAGHGHMIQPKGRTSSSFGDPKDTQACDSNQPGQVTSFKSGEEIDVVWVRNNHIGGFIRYAIVPKNQVSKANFDNNAFYYTCRESQCDLKKCNNKYCGDDAGAGDDGIKCRAKIKLPDHLPAGDYVLQWTWHAAGSSYGHIGWSTSNFKTCADIKLTTSGTGAKPKCPSFVGGDRVTAMEKKPSDQCFYYDDNGLGKDYVKYSDEEGYKRYKFGVPKEIETCGGGASNGGGNVVTPSRAPNSTAPSTSTPVKPSATPKPKPTKGDDDNGNEGGNDTPATTTSKPAPTTSKPAPAKCGRRRD